MYNVGDKVKIVDGGRQYSAYRDWVKKYSPINIERFGTYSSGSHGDVGIIISKGYHLLPNTEMLYLVDLIYTLALISEDGIELITKGDEEMSKTYKIEEVISLMRENPSRKFTYDEVNDGSYIELVNNDIIWNGAGQNGQPLLIGEISFDWVEVDTFISFREVCEVVAKKHNDVKVKVTHPNHNGYDYDGYDYDYDYFDDYINHLQDVLLSDELAEVFLNGKWYVKEV